LPLAASEGENMNEFKYAVLVGRFQPFHSGHLSLVQRASYLADQVILVIGSHKTSKSIRNPWDSTERAFYIKKALAEYSIDNFQFTAIADSSYNFNDWLLRLQRQVTAITKTAESVAVIGHFKDDSSYYLNYFPQWALRTSPSQADGISSTDIRKACFENRLSDIKSYVCGSSFEELRIWMQTNDFKNLQEEWSFVQEYRKKWTAPYYVTTDNIVVALGHVLLVRRGRNPGKGKLALPGGFLNPSESLEDGALRELKEETKIAVSHRELQGSIKMSHVFDHPQRDPRGRIITHGFLIELTSKELPKIEADDDASEAFWFPLYKVEEAEEEFFSDHAQIIKFFINRLK
jgi:bifunctional NMN adenylyltransferase/nudix hydrolase